MLRLNTFAKNMKKPACCRINPVNHDDTLTYITLLSDIDVRPKHKKSTGNRTTVLLQTYNLNF